MLRRIIFSAVTLAAAQAYALTPQEVFVVGERSVVTLDLLDSRGEIVAAYSAIAIEKRRLVSQCDDLDRYTLRVQSLGQLGPAMLERRDDERNLCTLTVKGLELTPIKLSAEKSPSPGSKVFAIGNMLRMGISISEGVVSGLRDFEGGRHIQFTASIGPGSQGGGLFDSNGQLLGLIRYRPFGGQNVNFASPVQWLTQIDPRAQTKSKSAQSSAQAQRFFREQNWNGLAQHAQTWVGQDPSSLEAYSYLGESRLRLGQWREGENAFRELLKREPRSIYAALGISRSLAQLKEHKAAIELLRPYLTQNPENSEILSAIGAAQLGIGQVDNAQHSFEHALVFGAWNQQARYGLADVARTRKDWPGVVREMRAIASSDLSNTSVWLQLAEAYVYSGRPARALTSIERILEINPKQADAMLWKGIALISLKRKFEGVDWIKRSLQGQLLGPQWAWASLGDVYSELKLWPEAIDAYRAGLKISPEEKRIQQGLGIALKDSGHFKEALSIFEPLNAKYPNDPLPWRQIGFVNGYLDEWAKSIPAFERSLALDSNQPKVWRALMEAYHSTNRNEDMRRTYDRLAMIDRGWAEQAYRELILPYEGSR